MANWIELLQDPSWPPPVLPGAKWARIIAILWVLFLIFWLPAIPAAGMMFDAGYTWTAYLLSTAVLTYPIFAIPGIWFAKKRPIFILLSLISVCAFFISGL